MENTKEIRPMNYKESLFAQAIILRRIRMERDYVCFDDIYEYYIHTSKNDITELELLLVVDDLVDQGFIQPKMVNDNDEVKVYLDFCVGYWPKLEHETEDYEYKKYKLAGNIEKIKMNMLDALMLNEYSAERDSYFDI